MKLSPLHHHSLAKCNISHFKRAETQNKISGRGETQCISHRWLCSGRDCLLTDWIPWGRRPGPLSRPPAQARQAARILWEEQSWAPESWRSQLALSAPGTHRHHMSSWRHTVVFRRNQIFAMFVFLAITLLGGGGGGGAGGSWLCCCGLAGLVYVAGLPPLENKKNLINISQ